SETLDHPLSEVLSELDDLMKTAREGTQKLVQGQITILRDGHERNLSVRVSAEQTSQSRDSYIITLDDITDLVSAQRTSAWGDVARRIAHEIEPVRPEELGRGRIDVVAAQEGDDIMIDVVDNGIGLPKVARQRLLEPYVTTRQKGTGLGLAIVGRVLEDHGGKIELKDASD